MPKVNPKQMLEETKSKATSIKAWELPKVDSSVAPANVWSNIGKEPLDIVQVLHANLLQTKTRSPQRDGHGVAGHFLVTGSVIWQMCMEYRTKELRIANSTRNGWLAGSSVLAVGLTWRECIPLVLAGGLCNAIAIGKFHYLVDAIGTRHGTNFYRVERSNGCPTASSVSCGGARQFWILVQLLLRRLEIGPGHVLVWCQLHQRSVLCNSGQFFQSPRSAEKCD